MTECRMQAGETPIQLSTRAVTVTGRTMHLGLGSCGWEARKLGTLAQAASWARRHAFLVHPAQELAVCADVDDHIRNPRDGFCRLCLDGYDFWTPERREQWAMRQWEAVE